MHLRYTGNKEGHAILWVHGFCLSSAIWDRAIAQLPDFCHITTDLPGFGKTPFREFDSLAEIALQLYHRLKAEGIRNIYLAGHSLGGYICLELIKYDPDFCNGLILVHSSPFADTAERKETRSNYLKAFRRFGKDFFLRSFYELLFYQDDPELIAKAETGSSVITTEVLIAYTTAMRDRPGYEQQMRLPFPRLIVAGVHDEAVSSETYLKSHQLGALSANTRSHMLLQKNSAHMSMLEEAEQFANGIRKFIYGR